MPRGGSSCPTRRRPITRNNTTFESARNIANILRNGQSSRTSAPQRGTPDELVISAIDPGDANRTTTHGRSEDEEVLVVGASDSELEGSDVEILSETDSNGSVPRSINRAVNSTTPPRGDNGNGSQRISPNLRLSSLAQRFSQSPLFHQNQQHGIVEIVLDENNQPGDEVENDEEVVEVLRRQPVHQISDSDPEDEVEMNNNPRRTHDTVQGGVVAAIMHPEMPAFQPEIIDHENAGDGGHASLSTISSSRINISEQTTEDNDGDSDHDEGPPQKIPRMETSSRSDEDDGCHICYEPYENSGAHRPCCLKCGHIFGKDCIERWIKAQKRCPDCNCKAMVKDIRIIYVKNLKAIDTAELERMKADIDRLKIEKNRVELANSQLRCQVQLKNQENERLRLENKSLQSQSFQQSTEFVEPSTSAKAMEVASSSSIQFPNLRMPKLNLMKKFSIKEGQSRVGAYNEWMNLIVVSHGITSALFPGGSFGIKKINSLNMKAFQSFPVHQKPIRDMAFSLLQNDLLLTVSLDKKAVLFNCNSNCTVQTFNTSTPLWSCCWNSVDQNVFYVGGATGQVSSYDIRAPQEPVNSLFIPTNEKSPVARLKFVPPTYQSQSFNMSGLLIQKLNSVWFSEMLGGNASDPRYHQLPLEGPFLNVDFEAESRHVLVSSRPNLTGQRKPTSHTVCNLGKAYSEAEERDIFSCDVVQVMNGGFQESSILCRSTLFSPHQRQVYVAANGERARTVRVWDVANIEQNTLLRINHDAALDFVNGNINDTSFLGIVTENELDVYDIK